MIPGPSPNTKVIRGISQSPNSRQLKAKKKLFNKKSQFKRIKGINKNSQRKKKALVKEPESVRSYKDMTEQEIMIQSEKTMNQASDFIKKYRKYWNKA